MKFTYPPDAKPVDGYTIRRGLHRGGFGEVYYAVSDAGKEVALKLLTHDLDTELRGVRQCLNLKHSNLVTIFDVRTDAEGDTWVIMEYVSGASLEDVLNAFPNGLPLTEVRDWMAGMLAGTEYLHSRGIVHRDLKPANVYRENGTVKIGDVGLSKQMGGTRRQHTEAVGTVYYMAPEVARGQYGSEVDVYSLGVMLYEMLTGRLPFDGETTAEILMKHLSAAPDLSAIPASLRGVIAHALEKDPAKRIRTARQFNEELGAALKFEPLPESAFEPSATASPFTGHTHAHRATASGQSHRDTPVQGAGPGAQRSSRDNPRGRGLVGDVLSGVRQHITQAYHEANGGARVGAAFAGVREHVRDRVDRALERERRRQEKRQRRSAPRPIPAPKPKRERGSFFLNHWPWIIVVLVLFVPWHRMSWNDTGESAAMIAFWGCLLFAIHYFTRTSRRAATAGVPLHSATPPPVRISTAETVAMSWLLAACSAVLMTIAGIFTWAMFLPQLGSLNPPDILWLTMGSCLAVVAVNTTMVLLTKSSPEGTLVGQFMPMSWMVAAAGVVVGLLVASLGEFLAVRDIVEGPARPVFRYIGAQPLVLEGHPTTTAYMLFFGGVLWLQKWEKNLNRLRPYRLRLGPVAWGALAGFLGSLFTGIPVPYAVVWGMVITASAQIAAPWQPGPTIPVESAENA